MFGARSDRGTAKSLRHGTEILAESVSLLFFLIELGEAADRDWLRPSGSEQEIVERIVGTLFALTLVGNPCEAWAEPRPLPQGRLVRDAQAQAVGETRAKTESSSAVLTGLDEPLIGLELASPAFLALADADRDGRVSQAEFQGLVRRQVLLQVRARFERLDRNKDGWVTRPEVPSMDRARFTRFDRNGDEAFTVAELASVLGDQVVRRCDSLLIRYDADGDGALSAADAAQRTRQRVSKLEVSDVSARSPATRGSR